MADHHVIKAAKYDNRYFTGFDVLGNPNFNTTDVELAIHFETLAWAEEAAINILPGEEVLAVTFSDPP